MKRMVKRKNNKKKLFLLLTSLLLLFGCCATVQAAPSGKPKITKVLTTTTNSQRIHWTKVNGATGYIVAYKTPGSKYIKAATVTGGSKTYAYATNRLPNSTYTYRVKPIGGKWSGAYTTTLNKEIAVYGREVPYEAYGRLYTSASAAKAHLTTITVKTWDFVNGKSGAMYTRSWSLTIHKNLATTVKKIFNELYKIKFPIHELGGWRWESSRSEHRDGTAIDINWTENPYVVNGKILVGSYYRPGKDPYSIPTNGKVVKIFEKYGFSQGLWRNSQDYMHFSYFGT